LRNRSELHTKDCNRHPSNHIHYILLTSNLASNSPGNRKIPSDCSRSHTDILDTLQQQFLG